jgi:SnoaL-like domain
MKNRINNIAVVMAITLAIISGAAVAQTAKSNAKNDDVAALAARVAALDTRVTRLEDANQIERVQRTYGYFVDKGLWTPLSELFSDDATLEIGGRGVFVGRKRVLEYMVTAFHDLIREGAIQNHMQFQQITDIDPDGLHGKARSRAYVMAGGWGLPLYENEFVKENGVWKISKLVGPFTMYTGWDGWHKSATPNTRPDSFMPPPDLPPSVVYLTYPSYYVIPFHYSHPVTGIPWKPLQGPIGGYPFAPPAVPR